MSVNDALPHIFVLPEDDADRQLANGFLLEVDYTRQRQMQVLPVARGWHNVLRLFSSEHVPKMNINPNRHIVLLIDFDGRRERLEDVKAEIPSNLADRVFVLGPLSNPEHLKQVLGPLETIGSKLAQDCRDETDDTWGHELLQHNAIELSRLRNPIRRMLFQSV
jgi:hypothetical protein